MRGCILRATSGFLLILVVGCYEVPIDKTHVESEEFYVKKIKVAEDHRLVQILGQISDKTEKSGRVAQTNYGKILIDEAVKLNQPADSTVRYSLMMSRPDSVSKNFENLVIRVKAEDVKVYKLAYEPNSDWLREDLTPNWLSFTGNIQLDDFENGKIINAEMVNGRSINAVGIGGRTKTCCEFIIEPTSTGGWYVAIDCGLEFYWSTFMRGANCGSSSGGGSSGGGSAGGGGGGSGGGGDAGGASGGGGGGSTGSGHGDSGISGNNVGVFAPTEYKVCQGDDALIPVSLPCPNDPIDNTAIIQQFRQALEFDPFFLVKIDCDQLPKWQQVAQHVPPQSVIDKLNSLDDNYTSILSGDWEIQYIEEANSPIVNMDYYPIRITTLPKDPATGIKFTPEGFFNHVRKNLGAFFQGSGTEFGPYNSTEGIVWNSSNYLSAIMRFDIDVSLVGVLPGQQDGSVICSYVNGNVWRFTTIESPRDWNHPVSGTREFGLEVNPDGTYTFYTRGVDRVAEPFDQFMGKLPNTQNAFDGGDALWSQFQLNLVSFVNSPVNGGSSQSLAKVVNRPDWEKVKAVLRGERPIGELGCN